MDITKEIGGTPPPPCDKKVFSEGKPVALLAARMHQAEQWVQEVARKSGQRVDWHYSGGIAQVLFLGDRQAVLEAINTMPVFDEVSVMEIYEEESRGLYRAGVSEAPANAIAFFGEGNFIVAETFERKRKTKPNFLKRWFDYFHRRN